MPDEMSSEESQRDTVSTNNSVNSVSLTTTASESVQPTPALHEHPMASQAPPLSPSQEPTDPQAVEQRDVEDRVPTDPDKETIVSQAQPAVVETDHPRNISKGLNNVPEIPKLPKPISSSRGDRSNLGSNNDRSMEKLSDTQKSDVPCGVTESCDVTPSAENEDTPECPVADSVPLQINCSVDGREDHLTVQRQSLRETKSLEDNLGMLCEFMSL